MFSEQICWTQRAECLHCWLSPVHPAAAPGALHAVPWLDVPISPWDPDINVAVQPLFYQLKRKDAILNF